MMMPRRIRRAGHEPHMEKNKKNKKNAYRILVRKPEERPRCSWEDSIKMVVKEIRWGGMDWIDMAQDKEQWMLLVDAVINFLRFIKYWEFLNN
jgi:hypothetical protein